MPEVNKESTAFQQAQRELRAEAKKKKWTAIQMARKMAEIEKSKMEVEDLYNRINGEYDEIRVNLLPEQMEEEGLTGLKIEGLGSIVLTADLQVTTKGGAKEGLYQWLRENDLDDLIQDNVNASTLKSFVKKRMQEGKDYPSDFLNVHPFTRASIKRK